MKFFIGLCLFALTVGSFGYRITRDADSSSESKEQIWTDEQEKQAIEMMTQYCKNVSGVDDAVMKIKDGAEKLVDCVVKIFDINEVETKLKNTISESSEEMDEIFKEYCPKVDSALHCVNDFIQLLPFCLDQEDMDAVNLVINIVKRFSAFICYNNGERVIKFINDGGIDCIQENEEKLMECAEEAKEKYEAKLKEDLEDDNDDLDLKITKEDCDEYDKQKVCVLDTLKQKCAKKSIGEIIELLFTEMKDELKCDLLQNHV